jgi:serine/threonine protein kinase
MICKTALPLLQNCMVERASHCLKLIDFGLVKHLESVATLGVGTPDYMPPEMLTQQQHPHHHSPLSFHHSTQLQPHHHHHYTPPVPGVCMGDTHSTATATAAATAAASAEHLNRQMHAGTAVAAAAPYHVAGGGGDAGADIAGSGWAGRGDHHSPPLPYDARGVDAWAMGVVLYVLLVGRYPFEVGGWGVIVVCSVTMHVFVTRLDCIAYMSISS